MRYLGVSDRDLRWINPYETQLISDEHDRGDYKPRTDGLVHDPVGELRVEQPAIFSASDTKEFGVGIGMVGPGRRPDERTQYRIIGQVRCGGSGQEVLCYFGIAPTGYDNASAGHALLYPTVLTVGRYGWMDIDELIAVPAPGVRSVGGTDTDLNAHPMVFGVGIRSAAAGRFGVEGTLCVQRFVGAPPRYADMRF